MNDFSKQKVLFEEVKDVRFSEDILKNISTLAKKLPKPIKIMHICGTHEYTIAKNGLRSILPENITVIAGPGCPVCVCPMIDIDLAIELSQREDVIMTSFGDMMRVPSSTINLNEAKAQGHDVRVVYGPHEAVEIAIKNPEKEVVFFAVGFETTAPLIAFELCNNPPKNFSVICAYKLVPPAMDLLLSLPDVQINAFLMPGHVCAIIGSAPFEPYAESSKLPMVVAGFEVNDVLKGIDLILRQILNKEGKVENAYPRIVRREGNLRALELMEKAFKPANAVWRGIGRIPKSGYKIRAEFAQNDAIKKFGLTINSDASMPPGCACDQVLIGKIFPEQCPIFGKLCTPEKPVGPCMVSHEGSCKIAYTFSLLKHK